MKLTDTQCKEIISTLYRNGKSPVARISSDWNSFGGRIGQYSHVIQYGSSKPRKFDSYELQRKLGGYDVIIEFHIPGTDGWSGWIPGKTIYSTDLDEVAKECTYASGTSIDIWKVPASILRKLEKETKMKNTDSIEESLKDSDNDYTIDWRTSKNIYINWFIPPRSWIVNVCRTAESILKNKGFRVDVHPENYSDNKQPIIKIYGDELSEITLKQAFEEAIEKAIGEDAPKYSIKFNPDDRGFLSDSKVISIHQLKRIINESSLEDTKPVFAIEYAEAEAIEDDYEHGESLNSGNSWDIEISPKENKFDTIEDALKYVCKINGYSWDPETWYYDSELKKFYGNILVDENADEATDFEIQKWKKGEYRLWSCNISVKIVKRIIIELDDSDVPNQFI